MLRKKRTENCARLGGRIAPKKFAKEERAMVRKYKGTREEYEQKLGGRGE